MVIMDAGQTLDKPASPSSHQENGCKLVEEIKHVDEGTALLFGEFRFPGFPQNVLLLACQVLTYMYRG